MTRRHIAWLTTGLFALGWILCSLSCLGVATMAGLAPDALRLRSGGPVVVAGMSGLSLLLGIGWMIAARGGFLGRLSLPWQPRRAWLVLSILLLIIISLSIALPIRWHTSLLFAPVHAGLIVLTTLLILFIAAGTARPRLVPTARQWLLTLGFGALSALPAIALELIALLFVVLGVTLLIALFPDGAAHLAQLQTLLEQLRQLDTDIPQSLLINLLRSPFVLGILFLAFGVVAPLVEELVKTALVPILTWRDRGASLTRAYLWGVACGAGFAMLEGIGNGGTGLGAETWWNWASGILTRIPASAMHMFVSGLIGIGWAYFWRGQRWRLPLVYLLAITFHGLWNIFAVSVIGGTAFAFEDPLAMLTGSGWVPQVVVVISFLGLGMLVLVALLGAPLLPLALRRADERLQLAPQGLSQANACSSSPALTEGPACTSPMGDTSGEIAAVSSSASTSPSEDERPCLAQPDLLLNNRLSTMESDHECRDPAGPMAF